MQKVEAIIRTSVLDAVREALDRCDIGGLTMSEVPGTGHEPARHVNDRGTRVAGRRRHIPARSA